jgi:GTP-dependent phosphoenolpyruvate carboxykinase
MKENNFYKKLEMETDIIDKQYSFLEKHFQKEDDSSLLNSKNEESIRMVEFIMKVVNEDKKAVFKAID